MMRNSSTSEMSKPKILVQLDTDPLPSVFDAVTSIDAGVDRLLQYGGVTVENIEALVHGAIFTRGGSDLAATAISIGGSDAAAADAVAEKVRNTFFASMRVSVLVDSNGCNTTAAAAVLAAGRHLQLDSSRITVLGGTGPVGYRVARLLCRRGSAVRLASRSEERAGEAVDRIRTAVPNADLQPMVAGDEEATRASLDGSHAVIACGAAGVQLIASAMLAQLSQLRVAIDLNAVPPAGIESIKPTDAGRQVDGGPIVYGAIGVGGQKMKIHKAAIQKLFTGNDHFLDAEEVLALGESLG